MSPKQQNPMLILTVMKENIPRSRVVVFPDEICAAIWRPTAGNFVDTTLCSPIKPIVYTFDSPNNSHTSTYQHLGALSTW